MVLQLDREMEPAITGVEFDVPATFAGVQAARCCWVGCASSFISACHPGAAGNAVWSVDFFGLLDIIAFALLTPPNRLEDKGRVSWFTTIVGKYCPIMSMCHNLCTHVISVSCIWILRSNSLHFCMCQPTYLLSPDNSFSLYLSSHSHLLGGKEMGWLYITRSHLHLSYHRKSLLHFTDHFT